jgi:hypothetical protein
MPHFARIAAASSHAKPAIVIFSPARPYGSATIIIRTALAIYHIFYMRPNKAPEKRTQMDEKPIAVMMLFCMIS